MIKFKFVYPAKKYWRWLAGGGGFILLAFCLFFLRTYNIEGKKSIEIGNPKDALVSIRIQEIIKRQLPFFRDNNFAQKYTKIGWISDIHADRFKRRDVDSGLMVPRQYTDYLPKAFEAMRSQGIDTVIATGDNTNSGDDNYARAIRHIAQEKHMRVIWVKGNHDNDEVMSILGVNGEKYYYTDYGNTRIVVLDNVEREGDYEGSIDQAQLAWLKMALQTPRQVIVAMHIPIFSENLPADIHSMTGGNYTNIGGLLDRYAELENILQSSDNVKLVLSGHWHVPWHKEYHGINYYGQAALTRQNYAGAYATLDLQINSVEYLFAK